MFNFFYVINSLSVSLSKVFFLAEYNIKYLFIVEDQANAKRHHIQRESEGGLILNLEE